MSKRQKKKAPVVEGELEVEIITRVEYIYMKIPKLPPGLNQIINGERYTE